MPLLTHQREREDLEAKSERCAARAEEALADAQSARADAEKARAIAAELTRQLDGLQSTDASRDDAELLQVERDTLREAVGAIASIEASASRSGATAVVNTVLEELELLGIALIGDRNQDTPFDPKHHSAPGRRPDPGTTVRVGRPGYLWKRGQTAEVLIKARVTPVKREQTARHR